MILQEVTYAVESLKFKNQLDVHSLWETLSPDNKPAWKRKQTITLAPEFLTPLLIHRLIWNAEEEGTHGLMYIFK